HSRILTLLTDFGLSDVYVGVMKGVIAGINPALNLIDLTHQIPPQDISLARFALMTAFPYFPAGTIHVAVVDPGVGSPRAAIALAIGSDPANPAGFLVGPDNGLFSGVFSQHPIVAAIKLTNRQYWRTPEPSHTFHGRDIFAPVGAHLASGVPLSALGEPIGPESLVQLDIPPLQTKGWDGTTCRITGWIQASDHFGNLVTNIPGSRVLDREWSITVNGMTIPGKQTYSDSPPNSLVALVGSHGWVEIAVNHGSAAAALNLEAGDPIQMLLW
ncbi:MAG: SAM-dependent chlorinase/fluorinase, partial [Kovacikia sp.]